MLPYRLTRCLGQGLLLCLIPCAAQQVKGLWGSLAPMMLLPAPCGLCSCPAPPADLICPPASTGSHSPRETVQGRAAFASEPPPQAGLPDRHLPWPRMGWPRSRSLGFLACWFAGPHCACCVARAHQAYSPGARGLRETPAQARELWHCCGQWRSQQALPRSARRAYSLWTPGTACARVWEWPPLPGHYPLSFLLHPMGSQHHPT
mmetsp:Transcript_409/g.1048  ORF Transcript_409/g.1048 Transcript_409/m.1048 type:complete len:205 (-) Transcript_409:1951-2565(-)